jgi:hypothetical protein
LLLAGVTTSAACAGLPNPTPTPTYGVNVEVILDYGMMSYEQIIDDSDAIFLGQILSVSETSWNQDNGSYWDGGLPIYTIDVRVLRPIVDTLGLPEQVTVTQVGYSPLEYGPASALAAEQRAVFFVIQTNVAWRDGLLSVRRTTNTDTDSILVVGDDRYPGQPNDEAARLNEIVQDIAERREIVPQTP